MKFLTRDITPTILNVSKSYSALLLTGQRQVGKTTLLRHISEETRGYVSLDDLSERRLAKSDPRLFLELHPAPLIIDEVQYAPELFPYIKIQIDNGAPAGSFWLTGSQKFSLMRNVQETLAGRIAILNMPSLSQHEIYGHGENSPFVADLKHLQERARTTQPTDTSGLFTRIFNGSMPGHVSGKYPDRDMFYSSFVQTYIERDVTELIAGVDRLLFADFIRAAACRCATMLNVHAIANDVGVSDLTARRWLGALEQAGVIYMLHTYSNNLLKRTVKAPKLYFEDTGLVAYLTRYSSPDVLKNGALNGQILENFAVSEILRSYHNAGKECLLWYYRDFDQKEIDLILEYDGKLHPLEIKKAIVVEASMTKNFRLLEKAGIPIGTGALLNLSKAVSALDRNTLVAPIWAL